MAHTGEIAEKLRAARALIERGWTQRVDARDSEGRDVCPDDPSAVCWCAWGAIDAAVPNVFERDPLRRAFRRAAGSITTFNDTEGRTQAEVLAAFDKAIELAEQSA